jgi:hypothetical protein
MPQVSTARALLAAILIVSTPAAVLAEPAPTPLAPLAHSALLAVDGAPAADGLVLRVRRTAGETPLPVTDVTVTIDGHSEPATLRTDGTWFVPRPAGATDAAKTLEVTIGHDGIHEVLSGRLAAAASGPGSATSRAVSALSSSTHKQLAWWILNIVIVLIAAIAISRRMS